jgi:hypothetical protein
LSYFVLVKQQVKSLLCPLISHIGSQPRDQDKQHALIQNPHWDHTILFDLLSLKVDLAKPLPDSLPFHPSLPLSVTILMNDLGKVDIYRDDHSGLSQTLTAMPEG